MRSLCRTLVVRFIAFAFLLLLSGCSAIGACIGGAVPRYASVRDVSHVDDGNTVEVAERNGVVEGTFLRSSADKVSTESFRFKVTIYAKWSKIRLWFDSTKDPW